MRAAIAKQTYVQLQYDCKRYLELRQKCHIKQQQQQRRIKSNAAGPVAKEKLRQGASNLTRSDFPNSPTGQIASNQAMVAAVGVAVAQAVAAAVAAKAVNGKQTMRTPL